MSLKELTDKEIYSGKTYKGICRGVGVSLKSHAVKYLLCASTTSEKIDFAVSTAAIETIDDRVTLSKLRPAHPKNCARVFIGSPVYSCDGVYLGKVTDLTLRDFTATYLSTDQNARYPMTAVTACLDAVILKRDLPYPIGQRIPAPLLSLPFVKKEQLVTRPILRQAIQNGSLIALTLSLAPFHLNGDLVFRGKL